jgi:acylphosphatase
MAVRARLTVRGRVQGVWYRGSMQEEARRRKVAGWVKNEHDGTVVAEVEGEPSAVEAVIAWGAHRAARRARRRRQVEWPLPARARAVAVRWARASSPARPSWRLACRHRRGRDHQRRRVA